MVSEFNNLFLDSVAVLPLSEFLQTAQITHTSSFLLFGLYRLYILLQHHTLLSKKQFSYNVAK